MNDTLVGQIGELAVNAAAAAAAVISARPYDPAALALKGAGNFVTSTDIEAERTIAECIGRVFPAHAVSAEEGTRVNAGADLVWIVDPLDGTSNYVLGLPMVGVAVGCFDRSSGDARPVAGAIRLVGDGRCLSYRYSSTGPGAWLDGRRLAAPAGGSAPGVSLVFGYGVNSAHPQMCAEVRAALRVPGRRVVETLGPTTDWVVFATGRTAGVVVVGNDSEDTQVGMAAALAAGAVAVTADGGRFRYLDGEVTAAAVAADCDPEPIAAIIAAAAAAVDARAGRGA